MIDVASFGTQPIDSGQALRLAHCNIKHQALPTTNIRPTSFALVHFNVYLSFLYCAFATPSCPPDFCPRSSTKTSLMRLLTTLEDTGAYVLRQMTMPEVVTISKASNIAEIGKEDRRIG